MIKGQEGVLYIFYPRNVQTTDTFGIHVKSFNFGKKNRNYSKCVLKHLTLPSVTIMKDLVFKNSELPCLHVFADNSNVY